MLYPEQQRRGKVFALCLLWSHKRALYHSLLPVHGVQQRESEASSGVSHRQGCRTWKTHTLTIWNRLDPLITPIRWWQKQLRNVEIWCVCVACVSASPVKAEQSCFKHYIWFTNCVTLAPLLHLSTISVKMKECVPAPALAFTTSVPASWILSVRAESWSAGNSTFGVHYTA